MCSGSTRTSFLPKAKKADHAGRGQAEATKVAVAANGHAFDPSRLRVLRETSHRCSAGVGKQAFPDALIGVELPVHNRHYARFLTP